MRKDLNTCIRVIDKDGGETMFANLDEAIRVTGLTKRQLEIRATRGIESKGRRYEWCDPSTRKSYLGRKSRRKGNSWELEIIGNLKGIGYTGCVSSRSESRRTDDAKVDIIDRNNELPCHIQAKNTKNMPGYHAIERQCPLKDKPFVIACKLEGKKPVAILPLDFFYELIKKR